MCEMYVGSVARGLIHESALRLLERHLSEYRLLVGVLAPARWRVGTTARWLC